MDRRKGEEEGEGATAKKETAGGARGEETKRRRFRRKRDGRAGAVACAAGGAVRSDRTARKLQQARDHANKTRVRGFVMNDRGLAKRIIHKMGATRRRAPLAGVDASGGRSPGAARMSSEGPFEEEGGCRSFASAGGVGTGTQVEPPDDDEAGSNASSRGTTPASPEAAVRSDRRRDAGAAGGDDDGPGAYAVGGGDETSAAGCNTVRSLPVEAIAVNINEEMQNAIRTEILASAPHATFVGRIGGGSGSGSHRSDEGRCSRRWRKGPVVITASVLIVVVGLAIGLSVGLTRGRSDADGATVAAGADGPDVTTFDAVMERGYLKCGIQDYFVPGFSMIDEEGDGEEVGFYFDLCRAMAAAAFGRPDRVEFVPVSVGDRFVRLGGGDVDVVIQGDTHTFERDVHQSEAGVGFAFSTPYLYDGLAFAGIPRYVTCAEERQSVYGDCADLQVCVNGPSTWSDILDRTIPGASVVTTTTGDYFVGLKSGECNVVAGEQAIISESAARSQGYEGEYAVGDQLLSKEPLAIMTRDDDPKWSDFVNWVVEALLAAEERNITQSTAEDFPAATVFGEDHRDMFRDAVAAVGNYGEMYARHLEAVIPRKAINTLNTGETGLIYSHPFGTVLTEGPGPVEGGKLERILSRGHLLCGISANVAGLFDSSRNRWLGLDADFCRAVAAAIFEGSAEVVFVTVTNATDGFRMLADEGIDILSGVGVTLERDVMERSSGEGFSFSQPYFHPPPSVDGGAPHAHALATEQDDPQWSSFVYWVVASTFFAEEEGITRRDANDLPKVNLFGPMFGRMLRDVILTAGSYAEIYERNARAVGTMPDRGGRNSLNANPFGPQHRPLPFS